MTVRFSRPQDVLTDAQVRGLAERWIAVLAEKRVLATGTMAEMGRVDHPWVREYFHGPRARAAEADAAGSADRTEAADGAAGSQAGRD